MDAGALIDEVKPENLKTMFEFSKEWLGQTSGGLT